MKWLSSAARVGGPSLVALAWLSCVAPGLARAETSDQVNALFKRGVESYKEADYRAALVEFKRAYEASNHDYRVLYNIAQSEYQLTNYVGALAAFEKFLVDGGTQLKEDRRAEVVGEIAKLKGRVAVVTVNVTPASAKITVDGDVVGKSGEGIKLNPGAHRIEVTQPGFERATESVEVAGGDVRTVEVKLKAADTPAPPKAGAGDDEPSWVAPGIGFAVTGALAATTVVMGIVATGKESDLAAEKAKPNASAAELRSLDGSVGTFALVTDVFLGATVVAAGVSTYLTIRTLTGGPKKPESSARTGVRFVPAIGGGHVVGTF